MPHSLYNNLWYVDAYENISLRACLIVIVIVKSKTENQLIRFVIASR